MFPDLWRRAFKFTIERHPYEKVVSRVFWNIYRRGGNLEAEFDRELRDVLETAFFIDRHLYMINGEIAVDEIISFHCLWDRIAELGASIGRSLPTILPDAKAHHRKDRRPAAEILSARQRAAIRNVAAFEFDTFGFAP